jgi:hypothetical protein
MQRFFLEFFVVIKSCIFKSANMKEVKKFYSKSKYYKFGSPTWPLHQWRGWLIPTSGHTARSTGPRTPLLRGMMSRVVFRAPEMTCNRTLFEAGLQKCWLSALFYRTSYMLRYQNVINANYRRIQLKVARKPKFNKRNSIKGLINN